MALLEKLNNGKIMQQPALNLGPSPEVIHVAELRDKMLALPAGDCPSDALSEFQTAVDRLPAYLSDLELRTAFKGADKWSSEMKIIAQSRAPHLVRLTKEELDEMKKWADEARGLYRALQDLRKRSLISTAAEYILARDCYKAWAKAGGIPAENQDGLLTPSEECRKVANQYNENANKLLSLARDQIRNCARAIKSEYSGIQNRQAEWAFNQAITKLGHPTYLYEKDVEFIFSGPKDLAYELEHVKALYLGKLKFTIVPFETMPPLNLVQINTQATAANNGPQIP